MNEYLKWTDEQIVTVGKWLKENLPRGWQEIQAMPENTAADVLKKTRAINIYERGKLTYKLLKQEYIKRNEQ